MYKEIKIYFLVHFLSSMSTNKVASKLWISFIDPSKALKAELSKPYFMTPTAFTATWISICTFCTFLILIASSKQKKDNGQLSVVQKL